MKHLKLGYIFNGKRVPNTGMNFSGINQRMTDAADFNTTRPRMIKKSDDTPESNEDWSFL